MQGFVGQAILQTLVAALVVEGLLRLWRVAHPAPRLAFRLLVLLVPLLLLPAFRVLAPWRASPAFTDGAALYFGGRWASVAVAGIELDLLATAALAGAGVALYLVDLVPFLLDRLSLTEGHRLTEGPQPLNERVRQLAAAMRVRAPRAVLAETPLPLLFCSGLRPALVVSRATIDALDDEELQAALAHEVAHAGYRDPARGWLLMLARSAMCFNPAVQLVARAMVEDMERRADLAAAEATGNRPAMARALEKLGGDEHHRHPPEGPPPPGMLGRLRIRAVARRRDMLLADAHPEPTSLLALRLALVAFGLPWLLFYVI